MSIYRLGSDVWQCILPFMDAHDTLRLLLIGDTTLRTCLKPAIRDFCLKLNTLKAPKLSSLLNIFKVSSSRPIRFHISLDNCYRDLLFVREDYTAEKWKTFFPETLETLGLALLCDKPPFTSLLASLATIAPQLKILHIYKVPESIDLPHSLTFLEIGAPHSWQLHSTLLKTPMFIERLPSTLTHLKLYTTFTLVSKIEACNLPFRKMPLTLFHGDVVFSSLTEEQACWSIFPNTIVDLAAKLFYGEKEQLFKSPGPHLSWKQLFPTSKRINRVSKMVSATYSRDRIPPSHV